MARFYTSANMATFTLDDISTLDEVLEDMLQAGGDVVVEELKKTAKTMLSGRCATGELARSLRKGEITKKDNRRQIAIEFSGSRKRYKTTTRNAEIAYINEFGKKGQPARPFIATAKEQSGEKAAEAAEIVFDRWLSSKGF